MIAFFAGLLGYARADYKFEEVASDSSKNALGYEVVRKEFRSFPIGLDAGEVEFSNPVTHPLRFPMVPHYAITRFRAHVVDKDWNPVPLSEVYLHHWVIYNTRYQNEGACNQHAFAKHPVIDIPALSYVIGIGPESRNTPVEFPAGYGMISKMEELWAVNVHMLRTVGLKVTTNASQATKECIECWYAPNKHCLANETGTFNCCLRYNTPWYKNKAGEGPGCPIQDAFKHDRKTYHLAYTVDYTKEVDKIKPVHVYVLDASACKIDYNVYANEKNPIKITELSWKANATGKVVFTAGHVHNAGINITLYHNHVPVCNSYPTYGTEEGVAGNEAGYLVAMTKCGIENAFEMKIGDILTVRSHYWVGHGKDPTGSMLPGGMHGGVMSIFYVVFEVSTIRDHDGRRVEDPNTVRFTPVEGPRKMGLPVLV